MISSTMTLRKATPSRKWLFLFAPIFAANNSIPMKRLLALACAGFLLVRCGDSAPSATQASLEVNPCNCLQALEHANDDNKSILDACVDKMKDAAFKEEYAKCKVAEITGQDPADVVIPKEEVPQRLDVPSDGTFRVDPATANVRWNGSKITGSSHSGSLKIQSGSITFAGGVPSEGELVVDMQSIKNMDLKDDAERGKLEGHLKSADFFDVANHPTATFRFDTPGTFQNYKAEITGTLTVKGQAKPADIVMQIAQVSEGQIAMTGALIFNRTDFGVNFGSGLAGAVGDAVIKDDVQLTIGLRASKDPS